ncbi:hypothetical protein AB0B57_00925 [Micromonospora sp. NPDC049101]|uniref:hypothetical protein n=1 Tax=Micromonospora sp. NPDC049101 TaxID=3155032 RepID=UPI0033C11ABF
MALTYETSHGHDAARFFGPLVDLYECVYAEPPYEEGPDQVARFRDNLPGEAARPGFTFVTVAEGSPWSVRPTGGPCRPGTGGPEPTPNRPRKSVRRRSWRSWSGSSTRCAVARESARS